jgi:plasmid stabilization system protein ParE
MASKKIIWTEKANFERQEILEYWMKRNKSTIYSVKLNKLFIGTIKHLSRNPMIGRKTDFENVCVKLVRNYLIFYECDSEILKVLSIWDGKRNEENLRIK